MSSSDFNQACLMACDQYYHLDVWTLYCKYLEKIEEGHASFPLPVPRNLVDATGLQEYRRISEAMESMDLVAWWTR